MRLEKRVLPPDYGLYRVVGNREYRGHAPGSEFEARIEREAERRAVVRGDVVLLKRITPELQPGSFHFPQGWLASPHTPDHRDAARRLTR